MRYLPAAIAALSIGAAVIFGLYLTKDGRCLFGLIAMYYVKRLLPPTSFKTENGGIAVNLTS